MACLEDIHYIVCSSGMQSQAFKHDSYKTLTLAIFVQGNTLNFYNHAMINPMEMHKERILLIENDSQICDIIAEQTLRPLGYQVEVVDSAATAINDLRKIAPDLIITNLIMPEFSGKDLLVALASQDIKIPVVIITSKKQASDALRAFRLGAINFISIPIREAEVVKVIEDTLNQVRRRDVLESTSLQLAQSKEAMEQRIRNFTEIFSIARLLPNAPEQHIYEKITHAGLNITQAELAWLLVLDRKSGKYILRAGLNLSQGMQAKLNSPYEDGMSSLMPVSGQAISMHGEALSRFNFEMQVESVLAVPIKRRDEVTGILVMARKRPAPFTHDQQSLLETIAEYAAVLFENSILIQDLDRRLALLQQSSISTTIDTDLKEDLLHQVSRELQHPINRANIKLDVLSRQIKRLFNPKQAEAIDAIRVETNALLEMAESIARMQKGRTSKTLELADLNEIVREIVIRSQDTARAAHLTFKLVLPQQPARVMIFASQITKVIEGMVSNALKYSPPKSEITILIEVSSGSTRLTVQDQGKGVNQNMAEWLFDKQANLYDDEARRFGGLGISLPMMKEIITAHRGEISVESNPGKGFTISFTLPNKLIQPYQV